MQSRDPSTNVVLLEDAAAVLSVAVAATCMGLTSLTGKILHRTIPVHDMNAEHLVYIGWLKYVTALSITCTL